MGWQLKMPKWVYQSSFLVLKTREEDRIMIR
jgi:hypothetical protein